MPPPLRLGPYEFDWGRRTYVMGIVNCSPDSFSGDGASHPAEAVARGRRLVDEGADLLDVGGESTRPGAVPIDPAEELRRVMPVMLELAQSVHVPISIDTTKAVVARAALAAGAHLVNDVSGFMSDPEMADVVREYGAAAVVMANHRLPWPPRAAGESPHSRPPAPTREEGGVMHRDRGAASSLSPEGSRVGAEGEPEPAAPDLIAQTRHRWEVSLTLAAAHGVPRDRLIVDPGLGFGLRPEQSLELLRRLPELCDFGRPLLVGPSRKGFIGHFTGDLPVQERLEGTLAAAALAIARGADIVRVHDVRAAHRVRLFADALCRDPDGGP